MNDSDITYDSREKFREMWLYVEQQLGEQATSVGKILCLLYIADLESYQSLGYSITGTGWQKGSASWPLIPVPNWWERGWEEFLDSVNVELVSIED